MGIEDKQPPKTREQVASIFQIGEKGISSDYLNFIVPTAQAADFLDNERLVAEAAKQIKEFPSYSEYMQQKGKIDGLGLSDFFTPASPKIVERLDEIAVEVRNLFREDPKQINWSRIQELSRESLALVRGEQR